MCRFRSSPEPIRDLSGTTELQNLKPNGRLRIARVAAPLPSFPFGERWGIPTSLHCARKAVDAMMDRWLRRSLVMFLAGLAVAFPGLSHAQGPGTTPSLPEIGAASSKMARAPGSGGGGSSNLPGTGGYLGGRAGVTAPKGIPTSIVNPASAPSPTAMQIGITAPQPEPLTPSTAPFVGPLSLPSGAEDDGPPDGLTLEQAITSRSSGVATSAPSSTRSPRPKPTSSRPASGPIRSSTRTGSFLLTLAVISVGLYLGDPASTIRTSPFCWT